jgi:hypothetical protein
VNQSSRFKKKLISLLTIIALSQGLYGAPAASAACLTEADLILQINGNGTFETCGGDDRSYRIPIVGSVVFGGVTYTSIFATTNSVITFGSEDGEYEDFPDTPSISIQAKDWVVDGYFNEQGTSEENALNDRADEFLIITVSDQTFRVDISARQFDGYFPMEENSELAILPPAGNANRRILDFARQSDGTLRILYFSNDLNSDDDVRNGCVLSEGGRDITLEECGIITVSSVEAIDEVVQSGYLLATTPLLVSQTKDEVLCTSAGLKYVQNGALEVTPQLTSQTYLLEVNGEVIAKEESLDGVASFKKSALPANGVVTCSQVSAQGEAQIIVESEIQSVYNDAAKIRKAEVRKILADFYSESQRLLQKKLTYLSTDSSVKYSVAVENWKADLFVAQSVRDLAIKAAYEKEAQVGFIKGMKVTIN